MTAAHVACWIVAAFAAGNTIAQVMLSDRKPRPTRRPPTRG